MCAIEIFDRFHLCISSARQENDSPYLAVCRRSVLDVDAAASQARDYSKHLVQTTRQLFAQFDCPVECKTGRQSIHITQYRTVRRNADLIRPPGVIIIIIIIINGGTQGLGEALARKLVNDGAAGLLLSGRSIERGKALVWHDSL